MVTHYVLRSKNKEEKKNVSGRRRERNIRSLRERVLKINRGKKERAVLFSI